MISIYLLYRSLGSRWAPTSRPAARTPDPGPPTPDPGRLWALRACLISSLDSVLAWFFGYGVVVGAVGVTYSRS